MENLLVNSTKEVSVTNEDSLKNSTNNEEITSKPVLSRNQQKKLVRLEKSLQYKMERRKREREMRKLKGKNNYAVVENANGEKVGVKRKELKKNLMANSSNKLRLVVDCSFEDLMNFSDINHLCKQLTYCYAANRRIVAPLQFYMTSCNNKVKETLEKSGLSNWDAHLHEKSYLEVFSEETKENICYLTSDSPNELEDFDDKKIYIIGGLVDHNHHKSLCYNLALKNNISHCRLPINKFMNMKTRPVLTVNQVFQIVCKYTECKDWKQAFMSTLPKRKGAEALSESDDNESSNKNKKLKTEDDAPVLEEVESEIKSENSNSEDGSVKEETALDDEVKNIPVKEDQEETEPSKSE